MGRRRLCMHAYWRVASARQQPRQPPWTHKGRHLHRRCRAPHRRLTHLPNYHRRRCQAPHRLTYLFNYLVGTPDIDTLSSSSSISRSSPGLDTHTQARKPANWAHDSTTRPARTRRIVQSTTTLHWNRCESHAFLLSQQCRGLCHSSSPSARSLSRSPSPPPPSFTHTISLSPAFTSALWAD